MKWYFCLSDLSINRDNHGWADLARGAVMSAKQNTTLSAHMLFDGPPCHFTREIEELGVNVIHTTVKFRQSLEKRAGTNKLALGIMCGAYLRTQIPNIETQDKYV
jgi:hypothetical protein